MKVNDLLLATKFASTGSDFRPYLNGVYIHDSDKPSRCPNWRKKMSLPRPKYLHEVKQVYAGVREPKRFMTFPVYISDEYVEVIQDPRLPFNAIGFYQVNSDLTLCSLADYKPDSKVAEAIDDLNSGICDLDAFMDWWMGDEI